MPVFEALQLQTTCEVQPVLHSEALVKHKEK